MIARIKNLEPLNDYKLYVVFDDGKSVIYDMTEDMNTLPGYSDLKTITGLFKHVQLDESRTCIFWNDHIDLPSDILYEYGEECKHSIRSMRPAKVGRIDLKHTIY